MRLLRAAIAALAIPAVLGAQTSPGGAPSQFDLSRLRFGTDTFDLRVLAVPGQVFVMTETLTRGTGADTGTLRLVARISGEAENGLTSIDSVTVDARTLRLRSAVTVRLDATGRELYRATERVRDGEFVVDAPSDTGRQVRITAVKPDSVPLAIPNLVMRAAPLTAAWRASMLFRIPSSGGPLTVHVDSVTTGRDGARHVWRIHANPGDRSRLTYTIDSLTRDLIRFSVRDERGQPVSDVTNRRYVAGKATTPLPAGPPAAADVRRVAGHYYLEGVREVGSELLLRPDGTFEWMLAYGALDETSSGRWYLADDSVLLQSAGSRTAPGIRWFERERLTIEPGRLSMRLNGRMVTYVRH